MGSTGATDWNVFLTTYMIKGGRFVPARLQAALALFERLREFPSVLLGDHLSQSGGSAGIKSHETYGHKALLRLNLIAINKTHGRRSSNLPVWGQPLLDAIASTNFAKTTPKRRNVIIDDAQSAFAAPLRKIVEQDPIDGRMRERTAEAVINDILLAAEEKGKSGEVAQYLVGAKLSLRLQREIPVYPANKSDRTSHFDPAPRLGDFEIENAVIEVAIGLPDDKHLDQISQILDETDSEVWLLTRSDRVVTWQNELSLREPVTKKRVVVTSVEAFVGQNITELGQFSAKGKADQLRQLFELYNDRWVTKVGTPGIRIASK